MDAEQACVRQRCGWGARGARGLDGGGGGAAGGSRQDRQEEGPSDPVPKSPGELGGTALTSPIHIQAQGAVSQLPHPAAGAPACGPGPAASSAPTSLSRSRGQGGEARGGPLPPAGTPNPEQSQAPQKRAKPWRQAGASAPEPGQRWRRSCSRSPQVDDVDTWIRGPNSHWAAPRPGHGDCDRPTWAGAAGGRRLVNDDFTGNTRASPPFSFRTLISMFREERRPHGVDAGERPGAVWSLLSTVGWIPTLAGGGGSPRRPLRVLRGLHGST